MHVFAAALFRGRGQSGEDKREGEARGRGNVSGYRSREVGVWGWGKRERDRMEDKTKEAESSVGGISSFRLTMSNGTRYLHTLTIRKRHSLWPWRAYCSLRI